MQTAQEDGARILLNGQMGNLGLSWPGSEPQQRNRRPKRMAAHAHAVCTLRRAIKRQRLLRPINRGDGSALHPDLARRVNVIDSSVHDPYHPLHPLQLATAGSLLRRTTALGAGRTIVRLYAG